MEKALRLRPWLVIYGAAVRDFPRVGSDRSPVIDTFFDSSIGFTLPTHQSANAIIGDHVKRYWRLYRYRVFVRSELSTWGASLARRLWARPAIAEDVSAEDLPPEATAWFDVFRITPQSFAKWQRWRRSREFDDYLEWMRANGSESVLQAYREQTVANFGPALDTPWLALRWTLRRAQDSGTRAVVMHFPENPVFRDPKAAAYFDPELSDKWTQVFARQAAAHGARFVDLRNALEPEDFYDLIHANLQGQEKLSARVAAIIGEEWRAWQREHGS